MAISCRGLGRRRRPSDEHRDRPPSRGRTGCSAPWRSTGQSRMPATPHPWRHLEWPSTAQSRKGSTCRASSASQGTGGLCMRCLVPSASKATRCSQVSSSAERRTSWKRKFGSWPAWGYRGQMNKPWTDCQLGESTEQSRTCSMRRGSLSEQGKERLRTRCPLLLARTETHCSQAPLLGERHRWSPCRLGSAAPSVPP